MAHKVGDKVVFVGREKEIGKYHRDFSQLMFSAGTVVEVGGDACEVHFEGFHMESDPKGESIFCCYMSELRPAP